MKLSKRQHDKDQALMAKLIRVRQATDITGKHSGTIYNWVKAGKVDTLIINKGTQYEEMYFYRQQMVDIKADIDMKKIVKVNAEFAKENAKNK